MALFASCLVLAPVTTYAGAWLEAEGHLQVLTTLTYHSSQGGFDDRGNPVAQRYSRFEVSPYIEYGAAPWLTIGAQPRYQWAQSGDGRARQSSQGWGDIDVFARVPITTVSGWIISAQGTAVLGDAYDRARRPAPGTGEDAFEARLLIGRSLKRDSLGYVNVEAAYRAGTGGVADQYRLDSALALNPWRNWLLLEEMFLTRSIGDGDGALGHAYDLIKVRSSAVYFITPHFGLQAGYERDVEGTGVSLGDAGVAGLWVKF